MSTKTRRSGRSVKPPPRLVSVGFDLQWNDGNEKPISTLPSNHSKKPPKSVSWNQELTKVRYFIKDNQPDFRPKTRSFTQKLNNDKDVDIEPNTEEEVIGRINDKQKPKKEIKKFICEDCGKICQRARDLQDHVNGVHLGLKDFHCGVPGCQESFSLASTLKRHGKIVHQNLKPFACPDCHLPFSTENQMRAHKGRVHDGIMHACDFQGCTKTYNDPSNLNRHVKSKHQN